ncbi:MAG: helix-hairpin-helix domain-containing protein [Phycisphaeraceae bacterium]|nr:helix-hairpin-helix domain-containing protein [Phycisphaeraceae bacterium]
MFEPKTLHQVQQAEARLVRWLPLVLVWLIVCIVCISGVRVAINRPLNQQTLPPQTPDFCVDINNESAGELMLLPGVGKTIAQRIVKFRETHGPFTSIQQLNRIAGISHKTLNRFKDFLLPLKDDKQQPTDSYQTP